MIETIRDRQQHNAPNSLIYKLKLRSENTIKSRKFAFYLPDNR